MTGQPDPQRLNPSKVPCPICGSQSCTVIEANDWLYLRRDDGFWGDGERLTARKCLNCQNVQLFAQQ